MSNSYFKNVQTNIPDYDNTPNLTRKEALRVVSKAVDIKNQVSTDTNITLNDVNINNIKCIIPGVNPQNSGIYNLLPPSVTVDATNMSRELAKRPNRQDDLIDGLQTMTYSDKILLKYALENICNVLEIFINNIGKTFDIITEKQVFSIKLNRKSIPHLLAFASESKVKNNEVITRFYEAIKEEFANGNKNYLENIKNIIHKYKYQIYESTVQIDPTYDKMAWSKIAAKTANLQTLADLTQLLKLNNIEIMVAKEKYDSITKKRIPNDKDSYILLAPTDDDNQKTSIIIEKDKKDKVYYIKSDCLVNDSEYDKLINEMVEGLYFSKTDIFNQAIVAENKNNDLYKSFKANNEKAKKETNQNLFDDYKRIITLEQNKQNEIYDQTNDKVTSFLNYELIISEIKEVLENKLEDPKLKEMLNTLLIKYFISTNQSEEEKNRFYYILAEIYCNDKKILSTLKECFIKSKSQEFQAKIFDKKDNIFECSIIKSDNLYLKLNIKRHNQTIGKYDSTVTTFGKEYNNIKNNINMLLEKIKNHKIYNNKSALEFLYLLHSYYELNVTFNPLINSIKSYSHITDFAIKSLKSNWTNIYFELIKIGYLKQTNIEDIPEINFYSFDELIKRYESNKNIVITNNLQSILNQISYERNSDNIIKLLNELNNNEIEYVLYIQKINCLKSIVSKLQTEESMNIYYADINKSVNRLEQINNIKRIALKKSYVKTLKKAG